MTTPARASEFPASEFDAMNGEFHQLSKGPGQYSVNVTGLASSAEVLAEFSDNNRVHSSPDCNDFILKCVKEFQPGDLVTYSKVFQQALNFEIEKGKGVVVGYLGILDSGLNMVIQGDDGALTRLPLSPQRVGSSYPLALQKLDLVSGMAMLDVRDANTSRLREGFCIRRDMMPSFFDGNKIDEGKMVLINSRKTREIETIQTACKALKEKLDASGQGESLEPMKILAAINDWSTTCLGAVVSLQMLSLAPITASQAFLVDAWQIVNHQAHRLERLILNAEPYLLEDLKDLSGSLRFLALAANRI